MPTVTVIQPTITEEKSRIIRCAAYCRVSSDSADQLNSFMAQLKYYENFLADSKTETLINVYADDGISGTNTKKREEFNRMIEECMAGYIDMVITKSISRFARNTLDCLKYIRLLKEKNIPVFFEKENINTLTMTSEFMIALYGSFAQAVSESISKNVSWGKEKAYREGKVAFQYKHLLGYKKSDDGKPEIVPDEAETVRMIFKMYLDGYTLLSIAQSLMKQNRLTALGKNVWTKGEVQRILKNEKYMGDALLQKTYTADFLTKKVKKNHGEVEQFYVKESHEAIIPKEQWEAAQLELERRDSYMQKLGLTFYGYGSEINPFSCRVVCGKCGAVCGKKSWKSRGVEFWQCNNRSKNHGVKGCASENLPHENLLKGFITAWNQIVAEREQYLPKWEKKKKEGNPLQKLRAEQMIELTLQPPLTKMLPELGQMVLERVIVHGKEIMVIRFLDGTEIKVKI